MSQVPAPMAARYQHLGAKCLVGQVQSTVWVLTEAKKWTLMSGLKKAIMVGPMRIFCLILKDLRATNPAMISPIAVPMVK